jgi:energy-coupling factor transporter transmembrane protein EcfT
VTGGASPAERNEAPLARWASPAARVLAAVLLIGAVATAEPSTPTLAAAAATGLVALALARPSSRWVLRMSGLACLAIAGVLVPVFATGDVELATRLTARALAVLAIALAFGWTQRPHELGGALRGLGVPASFATVLSTMLRQATSLGSDGRRLVLARQLRGVRGARLGPEILARLFLRSHVKAERAALAAELRGARAGCPRPLPLRLSDGVPVGCAAIVATAIHVVSGVAR